MSTTVVGIDPGLVHTGVVVLDVDTVARQLTVQYEYFASDPKTLIGHADQVKRWLRTRVDHIFIESYRPRGNSYATDPKMRELLADFRQRFPKAKVLDNTGVKKVVRRPLLEVLGLYKFPTTHHQDLQAAARILVYGMLKDDELNAMLTQVVSDHVDGRPWTIH